MNNKRIYSLDVLRIIAAAMIVMHHYQQITNSYFGGRYNFRAFSVVVEFFFFLSGFVAYKYAKGEALGFWPYIKKKALRLLPLVAITSVAYEVLLVIYNNVCKTEWLLGNEISLWGLMLNCLGIQCGWFFKNPGVNNPAWYVSVLLLCYVVYWLLDAWSRKAQIPGNILYLVMAVLGVVFWFLDWNIPFINIFAARGYYSFFWGLLLSRCWKEKRIGPVWTIILIPVLLGLYLIPDWSKLVQLEVYHFALLFLCYPVIVFLFLSEPVQRILNFKVFGILGASTYDVYLWHVPMMLAMYIGLKWLQINWNLDYYKCLYAFVAGAFVVGLVSYFIISRPIQKWINK